MKNVDYLYSMPLGLHFILILLMTYFYYTSTYYLDHNFANGKFQKYERLVTLINLFKIFTLIFTVLSFIYRILIS